jgi:LmbE family N-acetylglucosaminyl deacetylase
MKIGSVPSLGRYDCLFVSPHPGDATLSCIGRMLWERNRGLRVLVLVVFGGSEAREDSDALDRLGIDEMRFDIPGAPRRHDLYGSFDAVLHGRHPGDERQLVSLREALEQVILQTQVRHIYLPLGVGGHVDHRLIHEAGQQAVPQSPGREIFFYEERPYSFLPGAIWIRLGQLGARLPPAAHLSETTGIVQYMLRFQMSSYVRAHARSVGERMRCSRAALKQWMDARGWHPRRACGPRFQPVEHPLDAPALEVARELLHQHAVHLSLCTSVPRVRPGKPVPMPRLKRRDEIERYWLLLPPLESDMLLPEGVESLEPARSAHVGA